MNPLTPGLSRPLFRRLLAAAVSALFILAAAVLAFGGTRLIARLHVGDTTVSAASPTSVRAGVLQLDERYRVPARYLGRVEPRRDAALGFETGGTLESVRVREGQQVTQGELLATLDTTRLEAERAIQVAAHQVLDARRELAALTATRQKTLLDNRHASPQGYDEARLALAEIDAERVRSDRVIDAIDVEIDRMRITAPFDGTIGARHVDEGARLGAGQVVVELLERGSPEFRVGLASPVARTLLPGDEAVVRIGDTDYNAVLKRLRADIEPTTRTRAAIFELAGAVDQAAGAIGELLLERDIEARGAWVEVSALSEGIRGLWSLMIIDADGRIGREAVELLYADERRAYVTGALTEGLHYVTDGAHRITPGQRVKALLAER